MSRRVLQGLVVINKAAKTVIVKVERDVMHPVYHKYVKSHKKYAAHDETNAFNVGDVIRIIESSPISKTKTWVAQEKVAK